MLIERKLAEDSKEGEHRVGGRGKAAKPSTEMILRTGNRRAAPDGVCSWKLVHMIRRKRNRGAKRRNLTHKRAL